MKKVLMKARWLKFAAITLALVGITTSGFAANDYYHYDKQGTGDKVTVDVQAIATGSYFTALAYLPDGAGASLKGRLLAATGTSIYLQDAVDSSSWTEVGQTTATMDPSFIKVSPDGSKIALGQGWNKPLLVFPLSVITAASPPHVVTGHNDTKSFSVNYYDAAWIDNTYLIINGGAWHQPTKTAYNVGISTLDTGDANNNLNTILRDTVAVAASSGIAVDANKNIIYGNGYTYNSSVSSTGELRMLPADVWWNDNADKPDSFTNPAGGYLIATSRKFADRVLSAAHLGFDEEGNLHVGGGQKYGAPNPNTENGYVALINKQVISDTADSSITLYQIDESDTTQYRKIVADSCQNDSATGVLSYNRSLSVNWLNGVDCAGTPTPGSGTDEWAAGKASKLTTYRINTTRDGDSDGFADVADHSPWTNHSNNTDADNDGYGNIIDGDLDNDGDVDFADNVLFDDALTNTSDLVADLDGDGDVDFADNVIFDALLNAEAISPYYDTTF